ncbi:MAG TPA: histidine kinase [Calditrichaeota bacterium]|nr:histidine kinase [Calditrichota bacterium]
MRMQSAKMKTIFIVLIIYFIHLAPVQGQTNIQTHKRFERLSIEQGLSQSTVYSIIQDEKGFMWMATQDGLNRFDGYEFLIFNHEADNLHSLSHNDIRAIAIDKKGFLWIGTWGAGLDSYDPKTNRFSNFKHSILSLNSLSDNKISCLLPIDSTHLWVGTRGGGLNLMDTQKKTFKSFLNKPEEWLQKGNNEVTAIALDSRGNLWVGTFGGLVLIHLATLEIEPVRLRYNIPPELLHTDIACLFFDNEENMWVGTNGDGLYRFSIKTGAYTRYSQQPGDNRSLSDNHITAIFKDKKGNLWVGTESGLNLKDSQDKFIHFKHSLNNTNSLSHNRILSITEDISGLIWIGTDGGGISIYNTQSPPFNHYTHQKGNPVSLSNPYIWSIYEDEKGILWIGTDYGLNLLDRKRQKNTVLLHDPKNSNTISYNEVMSICRDKYGYFWIATWGGGLNRYDPITKRFLHFKHDPNDPTSLSDSHIRVIYEDPSPSRDVLWIGTRRGGLNRLDLKTYKITRFQHDPLDLSSLSNNSVLSILAGDDGSLWVGTWGGGLDKLTFQQDALGQEVVNIAHYKHNPNDTTSISSNSASILFKDSKGRFWVGTHGAGINLFDPIENHFTNISMKDGLPNNVIYGILEDGQGFLWLSTNNGLCRFNPDLRGAEAFKNYDESDGLQSNEFNNQAYFKSKSGELFFGGINGFNSFYPHQVKDNLFIPPVVITEFYIFNNKIPVGKNSLLKESIIYADKIELPYSQSVISFDFTAMNFSQSDKNKFAYRMEGFHDQWIYTSAKRRVATFTHLDPGEYVFHVKASNDAGVWNEEGARLKVVILPPFWKTAWFRFLLILSAILTIYIVYKWKVRNLEEQKLKLEEGVHQRTLELLKQKQKLEEALEKVNTLSGLLPICSSCKKIRDDKGYWQQIEFYIRDHSEADFSHSLCPECAEKLYPQIKKQNIVTKEDTTIGAPALKKRKKSS